MCMIFVTLTNAYVCKSMLLLTEKISKGSFVFNLTLLKPLLKTHLSATCSVKKFWPMIMI